MLNEDEFQKSGQTLEFSVSLLTTRIFAEKTDCEIGLFRNFWTSVTLTSDRVIWYVYLCSTHRPLTTCQISLKSKKLPVDGRMYIWTGGRTDTETGFIRSTRVST